MSSSDDPRGPGPVDDAPFTLANWPFYLVGRVHATTSSGAITWRAVLLTDCHAEADRACVTRADFILDMRVGVPMPDDPFVDDGSIVFPRRDKP